jgi:hypothetical protein
LEPQTQGTRLGETLERLASSVDSLLKGSDLSSNPAEATPDRALIFEVIGPVANFIDAARAVGLEWLVEDQEPSRVAEKDVDEEAEDSEYDELIGSGGNLLYVTMPTIRGLQYILTRWERFTRREAPRDANDKIWWALFGYLADVRVWSARDRVDAVAQSYIERMLQKFPEKPVRLELDLWFRENADLRSVAQIYIESLLSVVNGQLLDFVTIEEISYQAALIEIPGAQAAILQTLQGPLANAEKVMRVRPQSLFRTDERELSDLQTEGGFPDPDIDQREPIVALIDGYPVQNHSLLANRVDIEEVDVTGEMAPVSRRFHGTAMASLILHGDLGADEASLDRMLKVVPILAAPQGLHQECTPPEKLPIGLVHRAVVALMDGVDGREAQGERVVIINHSVCDVQAPFTRGASPWAKLLDYFSHKYHLLFVVSAGNCNPPFPIDTYEDPDEFDEANEIERQLVILRGLERAKGLRQVLSPAEAINVLTVGAVHEDASSGVPAGLTDPFGPVGVTNLASAVGLGVNRAIKPEIVEAGGRQLAGVKSHDEGVAVWAREHGDVGQLAAAPDPTGGTARRTVRTTGTSNAAALITRSAVRIADVVEEIYAEDGEDWKILRTRATILRALLVHSSRWGEAGTLLDSLYPGSWQRRREIISRFHGYGRHDLSRTLRADGSRITLLADDLIKPEERHIYRIPIPRAMIGNRELRRIVLTLAWSSPVDPNSARYRGVTAEIVDGDGKRKFWAGVKPILQPHPDAGRRGTVQHLILEDKKLINDAGSGTFNIGVQARAVLPAFADTEVPYALAVTLELAQPLRSDVFQDVAARVRQPEGVRTGPVPVQVGARS